MTPTRRRWVFALVCLALFMGALDSLMVTTALPAIGRALHARLSELEWTVKAQFATRADQQRGEITVRVD